MESPYDRLAKIYTNCFGHMTKNKNCTHIVCGKNSLEIFFSRTRRLMTLGLGIKHEDVGTYKFAQMIIQGRPLTTIFYSKVIFDS